MSSDNFDFVFGQLIGHEGKLSTDKADRGNWTSGKIGVGEICGSKYGVTGVTLGAYRRLGRSANLSEVSALGVDEAKLIFRKQYWNAVQADRLPSGLDYAVSDFAYNSGSGNAIPPLQRLVGVAADGSIGEITLAAVAKRKTGLIDKYCDARLTFLKSTYGWSKYKNGWTRRVADVRAAAKRLAGSTRLPDVPSPPAMPGDRADHAIDPKKTGQGRAGIMAGLGTFGTAASDAAEKLAPQVEMLSSLKWLFLALTLVSMGIGFYLMVAKLKDAET